MMGRIDSMANWVVLQEWKRQLPRHLALPPAGPAFYTNVLHPEFNIDADEAGEVVYRFEAHTKEVGKGVQVLRSMFAMARQARAGACFI
jgi:sorting nexin-9/18/33